MDRAGEKEDASPQTRDAFPTFLAIRTQIAQERETQESEYVVCIDPVERDRLELGRQDPSTHKQPEPVDSYAWDADLFLLQGNQDEVVAQQAGEWVTLQRRDSDTALHTEGTQPTVEEELLLRLLPLNIAMQEHKARIQSTLDFYEVYSRDICEYSWVEELGSDETTLSDSPNVKMVELELADDIREFKQKSLEIGVLSKEAVTMKQRTLCQNITKSYRLFIEEILPRWATCKHMLRNQELAVIEVVGPALRRLYSTTLPSLPDRVAAAFQHTMGILDAEMKVVAKAAGEENWVELDAEMDISAKKWMVEVDMLNDVQMVAIDECLDSNSTNVTSVVADSVGSMCNRIDGVVGRGSGRLERILKTLRSLQDIANGKAQEPERVATPKTTGVRKPNFTSKDSQGQRQQVQSEIELSKEPRMLQDSVGTADNGDTRQKDPTERNPLVDVRIATREMHSSSPSDLSSTNQRHPQFNRKHGEERQERAPRKPMFQSGNQNRATTSTRHRPYGAAEAAVVDNRRTEQNYDNPLVKTNQPLHGEGTPPKPKFRR